MRNCPKCGAEYDVVDALCPACDAELPAPYEDGADEEDNTVVVDPQSSSDSVFATGSFGLAGHHAIPPQAITILSGAEIFTGDGESIASGAVAMTGGRILGISDSPMPDPQDGSTYIDLTGKILAPGFIDIHIHGMMGIDTNSATAGDFLRFSEEAAKHGTTALVPTTVACPAGNLGTVLSNIRDARAQQAPGARLLGLHLESNFISPQFKGAQPPEQIFSPEEEQAWPIRKLIDDFADEIRKVTVAPEVPGVLDFIPWLLERGIIVSMGHSAATYEEAVAGIAAGATHATHLFNAMPPLHHRNPGLVGAALEHDEVYTEVVCDGMHLHPAVLSVVFSAKGAERVMAISDALQGAGMTAGEFFLGGQHVTIVEGVARLDSGTIAGSIATSDAILRLLVERVGWDLGEALMMLSTTPAEGMGLGELGRIVPGAVADLVVLTPELEVERTLVGGNTVYQRASQPA